MEKRRERERLLYPGAELCWAFQILLSSSPLQAPLKLFFSSRLLQFFFPFPALFSFSGSCFFLLSVSGCLFSHKAGGFGLFPSSQAWPLSDLPGTGPEQRGQSTPQSFPWGGDMEHPGSPPPGIYLCFKIQSRTM